MKVFKIITIIILFSSFLNNTFAGDKEDVLALAAKSAEIFNNKDVKTYFSLFVDDNTEFSGVASTLRYDANAWIDFIEGTANLAYVNYSQQENHVQVYNGNSAIVTGYFTFTWMEKGGQLNTQNGRASMVAVKQDGKWLIAHMHFSKMF